MQGVVVTVAIPVPGIRVALEVVLVPAGMVPETHVSTMTSRGTINGRASDPQLDLNTTLQAILRRLENLEGGRINRTANELRSSFLRADDQRAGNSTEAQRHSSPHTPLGYERDF
jgi:hypothetical protein